MHGELRPTYRKPFDLIFTRAKTTVCFRHLMNNVPKRRAIDSIWPYSNALLHCYAWEGVSLERRIEGKALPS